MSLFGNIMSTIFGGSAQAAPAASTAGAAPGASVDVTAILDKLADDHAEDLDWRKSIVDLMKLVGIEASLPNRRELAAELG